LESAGFDDEVAFVTVFIPKDDAGANDASWVKTILPDFETVDFRGRASDPMDLLNLRSSGRSKLIDL
jgi:hypothetical protein